MYRTRREGAGKGFEVSSRRSGRVGKEGKRREEDGWIDGHRGGCCLVEEPVSKYETAASDYEAHALAY